MLTKSTDKSTPAFSIKKRILSFKYAWNGLCYLFIEEHNARIHVIAALAVIGLSFYLKLNSTEWLFIILAIALVFITEIFNTAIENLCDIINPDHDLRIKKIKDIAAAAVLLASIVSVIIALFVFMPKLYNVLN